MLRCTLSGSKTAVGSQPASRPRISLARYSRLASASSVSSSAVHSTVAGSSVSAKARTAGRKNLLASASAAPRRSYADATGNFLKEADVEKRVIHVVSNFGKVDAKKVNRNSHFINDLGLDSLDEVELLMAIEDEFCIEMPDSEVEKLHTVDDAVKYIATHPTAK